MAIASLILGIIALISLGTGLFSGFCLPIPLILGVLAWIFGKNALAALDASEGNPSERGIAQAGMITGIIAAVLSVLGGCCYVGGIAGILTLGGLPVWQGW